MLPEIDLKKEIPETSGTRISSSDFPEIPDQLSNLSPIKQVKRGSNTKIRSACHYYFTNQTNKQSTNQTNKSLIELLGVKSGLGHDLLGFNKVRVIRVPGVNTRITRTSRAVGEGQTKNLGRNFTRYSNKYDLSRGNKKSTPTLPIVFK